MELKTNNGEILDLGEGIGLILEIDDLDVFFSWRLSSIAVVIEPKLKSYNEKKRILDKSFGEFKKDKDGETKQSVPPEKISEWVEKGETLLAEKIEFSTIGSIKLSELKKMSEEEEIPLSGKMIHLIRVVVVEDVDPEDGKPKKKEEEKSRASRRAKVKEKNEEEEE